MSSPMDAGKKWENGVVIATAGTQSHRFIKDSRSFPTTFLASLINYLLDPLH